MVVLRLHWKFSNPKNFVSRLQEEHANSETSSIRKIAKDVNNARTTAKHWHFPPFCTIKLLLSVLVEPTVRKELLFEFGMLQKFRRNGDAKENQAMVCGDAVGHQFLRKMDLFVDDFLKSGFVLCWFHNLDESQSWNMIIHYILKRCSPVGWVPGHILHLRGWLRCLRCCGGWPGAWVGHGQDSGGGWAWRILNEEGQEQAKHLSKEKKIQSEWKRYEHVMISQ